MPRFSKMTSAAPSVRPSLSARRTFISPGPLLSEAPSFPKPISRAMESSGDRSFSKQESCHKGSVLGALGAVLLRNSEAETPIFLCSPNSAQQLVGWQTERIEAGRCSGGPSVSVVKTADPGLGHDPPLARRLNLARPGDEDAEVRGHDCEEVDAAGRLDDRDSRSVPEQMKLRADPASSPGGPRHRRESQTQKIRSRRWSFGGFAERWRMTI